MADLPQIFQKVMVYSHGSFGCIHIPQRSLAAMLNSFPGNGKADDLATTVMAGDILSPCYHHDTI